MNNCCTQCRSKSKGVSEYVSICTNPSCECHDPKSILNREEYIEPTPKQEKPEWDWTKEFDKKFGDFREGVLVSMYHPEVPVRGYAVSRKPLMDFISQLLLSEKKSWVEEVKAKIESGRAKYVYADDQEKSYRNFMKKGYNDALDTVLRILSQELE